MKKAYSKPEAKKISFQYTKVVAASGQYCDQGWTKAKRSLEISIMKKARRHLKGMNSCLYY